MPLTPQPLWQASSACLITSTFPVQSLEAYYISTRSRQEDLARLQSVVQTAIGHFYKLFDSRLSLKVGWVQEVGSAHLLSPLLLVVVCVDGDDLACFAGSSSRNDGKTDATWQRGLNRE